MTAILQPAQAVLYPETDGLPFSDNTKQFRLIMTTQGGLDALFQDQNVFVAGNLLWLPVEGSAENKAPDVMVIFGQDKKDRISYKQWQENNLGPQVTFEFVSPNNTQQEVEVDKLDFYRRHGVEEYYIHDPDNGTLKGWTREGTWFQPIIEMDGWTSPLLGIRFQLIGKDLQLYYPNGEPFATYPEMMVQREQERQLRQQAERERDQERQQRQQTENQLEQAQTELARAALQLEQERQQRRQLAEQLSSLTPEQLQALGIDPEALKSQ